MWHGSSGRQHGLTTASEFRHGAVIFLTVLTLAAPALAANAGEAADWQPIEEIGSAAETFVHRIAGGSNKLIASAGYLDPRLRLPRCTTPLKPFVRTGTRLSGRVVVGVRCNGAKPWKVYLPVHVGVFHNVIVASRPLPRGHVVQQGDFELASRDVSGILGEYLSDPDAILGRRLTRSVTKGLVLTSPLLQDQKLISRGQIVTLNAGSAGVNIRMSGVAVSEGSRDQLIRVKNMTSGKIVEGRIRSDSVVEVMLP